MTEPQLISHDLSRNDMTQSVSGITERIQERGDLPHVSVTRQLDLLDQLQAFSLGRFLIRNQGLNGFWTHFICMHPEKGKISGLDLDGRPFTDLERSILEEFPGILATQERFNIFRALVKKSAQEGSVLASIPCGIMGDLLLSGLQASQKIKLVGIDLDGEALQQAQQLAGEAELMKETEFRKEDAWKLSSKEEFSLICSNGLNLYEPSEEKVTDLYAQFYQALKTPGILVMSFLTYPPVFPEQCRWDMTKVDLDSYLLQRIVFKEIIGAKWQCYRSEEQTLAQLRRVGFSDIEVTYDKAKIFPTLLAKK